MLVVAAHTQELTECCFPPRYFLVGTGADLSTNPLQGDRKSFLKKRLVPELMLLTAEIDQGNFIDIYRDLESNPDSPKYRAILRAVEDIWELTVERREPKPEKQSGITPDYLLICNIDPQSCLGTFKIIEDDSLVESGRIIWFYQPEANGLGATGRYPKYLSARMPRQNADQK